MTGTTPKPPRCPWCKGSLNDKGQCASTRWRCKARNHAVIYHAEKRALAAAAAAETNANNQDAPRAQGACDE